MACVLILSKLRIQTWHWSVKGAECPSYHLFRYGISLLLISTWNKFISVQLLIYFFSQNVFVYFWKHVFPLHTPNPHLRPSLQSTKCDFNCEVKATGRDGGHRSPVPPFPTALTVLQVHYIHKSLWNLITGPGPRPEALLVSNKWCHICERIALLNWFSAVSQAYWFRELPLWSRWNNIHQQFTSCKY